MVVGLVLVALMATAFMSTQWQGSGVQASEDLEPADTCRPLQETCRWQTRGGEAAAEMTALDGGELSLRVTLPDAPDNLMVLLTGDSMYMGEYPLKFEKTDDAGRYRVSFAPPYCSASGDDMVWRVTLRAGREPLGMPFRLIFESTK